jgi:hypothetical protein
MFRAGKVGGHFFLIGHGILMLCLGMALFSLGSVMTNPALDESGYTISLLMVASSLLVAGASWGLLPNRARPHRPIAIYLMVGALSVACWFIFWMIQAAPADIRFLDYLAGLQGLFWGMWYIRLAFHLQDNPRKAALLSVLAATTTFLGIVLATQSQLSKLGAVTEVACYAIFIGVQILLTAAYLYRECGTEGEVLLVDSPKEPLKKLTL